jgi:hypothetical protein
MYIICDEKISFVGICVNGARQEMHNVNSALLLHGKQSTCMSLVLQWASMRVSMESVCYVMIRGVNRVQKIRNTWTLGVV